MKSFALFLIVVSTLAVACSKKQLTYRIQGQLTDTYTKEVISDVAVSLYQKEFKRGFITDNYTFVQTVQTDSVGNYSFVIDRTKIYEIKIDVEDPQYYLKSSIYSSSLLNSEEVNYFDEKLEAKSWLRIHLKNPNIEPGEQLNLYKTKFKVDCEECCANGAMSFIEAATTTFKCATVGGSQVIVDYGLKGSSAQFHKEIDCIPFDTVYLVVNY